MAFSTPAALSRTIRVKTEKIHIVGIGDDGLEGLQATARELIESAELLVGTEQTLALVPRGAAERVAAGDDLMSLVKRLDAAKQKRIVLLAYGDPLFFGVARYLCDKLGKDRFEVLPHVSAMQMAFARVKESWDEAYLTDLAQTPLVRVIDKVRSTEKAGLFTTEETPPAAVARALLDQRIDYFHAYVCENLGSPDERVTHGDLAEIAGLEFSPLNVMVLVRMPDVPDRPRDMVGRRLFGNPDELFLQSHPKRGLLTPAEVRCIALGQLDLGPRSIVWDVGAGSGSVAIEAASIASGGTTYAIEMDPEDYQLISTNAQRFGVANLVGVLGQAPEAWKNLPDPDAVFVGGTGRVVSRLVELAYGRLKRGGRLVTNVGSMENLVAVRDILQKLAGDVQVWMINLARGTDQLDRVRFEAINPTFVVAVVKPA